MKVFIGDFLTFVHAPEEIALCYGSKVHAVAVDHRNGGIAAVLEDFQGFTDGVVIIKKCNVGFWG